MIVNSYPYNPSQQSQQQRCIGINQQNSIYGSKLATSDMNDQQQQQLRHNHMFDLATLQQEQQAHQAANKNNLFDSTYDDATPNSLAALATLNHSDHMLSSLTNKMMNTTSNKQHQTTDMSLYSPSSSTSLLYHHYDQINVPNDQSASNQNNNTSNNHGNFKRSQTTTILNPSNLFGQTNIMSINQHALASQQAATNQQHFMTNNKTTIAQQELYSSGAQYHLHQQSSINALHHHNLSHQQQPQSQQQLNNAYGLDNHQLMLDTILRQQHATANATTISRAAQHGYHNRPLSSSGASSMSGQSMALTYGRQPRQANGQLPPLPPLNSSKSQNTLTSVLQSHQTLNHLGLSLNSHLAHTMMDSRGPKKLSHHQFPSSGSGVNCGGVGVASRRWKRAQQRVQNFSYEYRKLLLRFLLLIMFAFSVVAAIKFIDPSNHPSNTKGAQPTPIDLASRPVVDLPDRFGTTEQFVPSESSTSPPDVLSSKLLIGEFVILNQNYTGSEAQRSVLAENIVKLMDQVFLSTEMRQLYSRMQVMDIRPHKPSGILVKCNIILSNSITYAAQQFGIALYESLVKSNERLANQPSFVIDKNSIRFNTIPDKELANVPPQLLPPGIARPDATPSSPSIDPLPKLSPQPPTSSSDLKPVSPPGSIPDQPQDQNAVVWSEWSHWSSCVDKNGICDPTRLHSRLRKCLSQITGEKVDDLQCRQRFNMQDLELEVTDCSATCAGTGSPASQLGVLADAPHVVSPHVAPPMMINPGAPSSSDPPSFALPNRTPMKLNSHPQPSAQRIAVPSDSNDGMLSSPAGSDIYPSLPSVPSGPVASQTDPTIANRQQMNVSPNGGGGLLFSSTQSSTSVSTQDSPTQSSSQSIPANIDQALPAGIHLDSHQQQMSCSNCTTDEICLLLINQKVPFCAKVKDRLDGSGCGGWCKAQDQLCQPVGQNAFKCTHNSECLPNEWRCHDSLCIPASKRCDGHENCFDGSDERYCV